MNVKIVLFNGHAYRPHPVMLLVVYADFTVHARTGKGRQIRIYYSLEAKANLC